MRWSVRRRDGFADVSRPQIQATARSIPMPKPEWGTLAVSAQVEIPLEGFLGEVVLLDAGVEELITETRWEASDDLSISPRVRGHRRKGH